MGLSRDCQIVMLCRSKLYRNLYRNDRSVALEWETRGICEPI